MEKLIELLNEYEKDWLNEFETYVERWYCERTEQILSGKWENNNELKPCEIISKKYWFIKWLVDNDKIYSWDIALTVYNLDLRAGKHTYTEYPIYESLLMLLAIQDNPIEYLISVLR